LAQEPAHEIDDNDNFDDLWAPKAAPAKAKPKSTPMPKAKAKAKGAYFGKYLNVCGNLAIEKKRKKADDKKEGGDIQKWVDDVNKSGALGPGKTLLRLRTRKRGAFRFRVASPAAYHKGLKGRAKKFSYKSIARISSLSIQNHQAMASMWKCNPGTIARVQYAAGYGYMVAQDTRQSLDMFVKPRAYVLFAF
jgi:hypothetical protein